MMDTVIVSNGLSKSFAKINAVQSLCLELESGKVFGLLGPNGAGKTTVVKLLLGLLRPSAGNATVLGLDSWRDGDEIRKRSSVVFEDPGLYPWLSGPENLDVFGRFHGLTSEKIRKKVDSLADSLRLSRTDRELPARKLSSGTRRKWSLCRALLSEPEVICLDEPTSGLDPLAARSVRSLIRDLVLVRGVTVLLCTHNTEEALLLCSRVGILQNGELLACNTPQHLRPDRTTMVVRYSGEEVTAGDLGLADNRIQRISSNEFRLDADNSEQTAKVIRKLVETGHDVYEVSHVHNPLEEALEALCASPKGPADGEGQ